MVSHAVRGPHQARHPQHITAKLRHGLPSLRVVDALNVLVNAMAAAKERLGMRLVHYSVQSDHLHLIVEASDRRSLSRGLQGLFVRLAKALNRLWKRSGQVFGDRFHAHALATPREVRNALAYVLQNAAKHLRVRGRVDPYTSGNWFDGYRSKFRRFFEGLPAPVASARTWLLCIGWRRHGLIDVWEVPGQRRGRARIPSPP